jgi:hypothetical protein
MDMVRSMLADRDSRSGRAPMTKEEKAKSAEDRRKLWQERLSEFVRQPARH